MNIYIIYIKLTGNIYIELAILVITGDGEMIDGHFIPFYLVILFLTNLEEVKSNESYFKQEKTTNVFSLFHSFSIPFSSQSLQRKAT